jgi:hypothetical protein
MNAHPFLWVRDSSRRALFCISAALAVLTMIALQVLGGPLKTESSPMGIVSFEIAGNLTHVETILSGWDPSTRVYAGVNLGLDYLFIDAYVVAIGLGCVLVAGRLGRHGRPFSVAGVLFAWGALLAGALDCVENYALIKLLLGSQANALAVVARACALPKFMLVLLGLLYLALGGIASLLVAMRGRQSAA